MEETHLVSPPDFKKINSVSYPVVFFCIILSDLTDTANLVFLCFTLTYLLLLHKINYKKT